MAKPAWTPWHKVVRLRDDVRTGELSLAVFAADIYDVVLGRARPVYQDPAEFFALTYPTFNMRELAKDVLVRLAGKNEKAVQQLDLTYGGGKTHTLIALYHLANDPPGLPDLPAVKEFLKHADVKPPKAVIAVLPFDKLDVEKGMEVRAPDGKTRWLKNPWSVLAYQIDGNDGLRLLHGDNRAEERDSAPAENLLEDLLRIPEKKKHSTLVLIDEVLMYAREKIAFASAWRTHLVNFFQYLTGAATKVDRCAIVASLLATDPKKSDSLGKEIAQELYLVIKRKSEEPVNPVLQEDVAEILRRRFFARESIQNREAFQSHVVAALRGIGESDDASKKEGKAAEERFLRSYPFHPDLTDVFYTKWTNLEGFQRTRGILRTFALALREAERWDAGPLVGVNVFLGDPDKSGLSEAARELATVAATEEYEGKKQAWSEILEGELAKAREIQAERPGLHHREVEQAVFGTFLHSQPIGKKASTRELKVLLGGTRPDRIELEKGLRGWAEKSWFLDDQDLPGADASGQRALPNSWRLGGKPNLRQMHDAASKGVPADLVDARLIDEIGKAKKLTEGAAGAGARVHVLPERPKDIDDDGEFHYAVLGPKAASESGKPSAEARRFLEETTSPDRPRTYKNAVVLAVPSREGLDVARQRIRENLGWEGVRAQLKGQAIDPIREQTLATNIDGSRKKIPEAIVQAMYTIAVTLSEKNEVVAFKIKAGDDPLFLRIKDTAQARIQETAVNAEALLPGGPYDLWREGEPSRLVKDLVGAFAQAPHLPKMLNRRAILDTIRDGCRDGRFVLRTTRPDRTVRTWWRQTASETDLKDPALEVALPSGTTLTEIDSGILLPRVLPDMWTGQELTFRGISDYFAGGRTICVQMQGYAEPIAIPKVERPALERAVGEVVAAGKLWLLTESASLLADSVPAGLLTDDAKLLTPPAPIPPTDLLPANLPAAWTGETTTAADLVAAASAKAGRNLPWGTVRTAIEGALRSRVLEPAPGSAPWPCELAGADRIQLRVPPKGERRSSLPPPPPQPGVRVAEAELRVDQIQELADQMGEITKAGTGMDIRFTVRVEVTPGAASPDAVGKLGEALAKVSEKLVLG